MMQNLENKIVSIISQFRGRLDDKWVEEYISLAEHNEYGLALESLCDQLFEFGVLPTPQESKEIKSLIDLMGLERELIRHP